MREATVMMGTLVLCVGVYGCNSTSTGGGDGDGNGNGNAPCTALTYENFAGGPDGFMTTYCTGCHSSDLTGADERQGATEGFDFDTLDGVQARLDRIRVRAVEEGTMPFQTAEAIPTADELDQLAEWIDCGAPA